jgi:hypothetical protein
MILELTPQQQTFRQAAACFARDAMACSLTE